MVMGSYRHKWVKYICFTGCLLESTFKITGQMHLKCNQKVVSSTDFILLEMNSIEVVPL